MTEIELKNTTIKYKKRERKGKKKKEIDRQIE